MLRKSPAVTTLPSATLSFFRFSSGLVLVEPVPVGNVLMLVVSNPLVALVIGLLPALIPVDVMVIGLVSGFVVSVGTVMLFDVTLLKVTSSLVA